MRGRRRCRPRGPASPIRSDLVEGRAQPPPPRPDRRSAIPEFHHLPSGRGDGMATARRCCRFAGRPPPRISAEGGSAAPRRPPPGPPPPAGSRRRRRAATLPPSATTTAFSPLPRPPRQERERESDRWRQESESERETERARETGGTYTGGWIRPRDG